jgi:signal transduction histidine kinase
MLQDFARFFTIAPSNPRTARNVTILWSLFSIIIGITYVSVYTIPYFMGLRQSLLLAVAMYALRIGVIIAIAVWSLVGLPLRSTKVHEQRQGHIIVVVCALLIALQLGLIANIPFDSTPYSLLQNLIYYLSIIVCLGQILIFVQHGWVRYGGALLLFGFMVEVFGSAGIIYEQRQALIPFMYVLSILIASLLVRWWVGLVLALLLAPFGTIVQVVGLVPGVPQWTTTSVYTIYLTIIAALAALYARSLESALTLADERAVRLEHESAAREREAVQRAQVEAYATQAADLATLEERNRIAREIHDGLGHHLMNVMHLLKGSRTVLASDPAMARETIEEAYTVAKEALDDVRRSVGTLRGSPLAQRSLGEVVTNLVEKTSTYGIKTTCTILGEPQTLPLSVAETLYRVIQEALTNIRKHAQATQAVVQFDYRNPQRVHVLIEDNGRGTDHPHGGFGLIGMHERIHQVDGTMTIQSASGEGFRIQIEVPA